MNGSNKPESAYSQGKKAFTSGKFVTSSPYHGGSMNNLNWRAGWRTAEAEHQQKVLHSYYVPSN